MIIKLLYCKFDYREDEFWGDEESSMNALNMASPTSVEHVLVHRNLLRAKSRRTPEFYLMPHMHMIMIVKKCNYKPIDQCRTQYMDVSNRFSINGEQFEVTSDQCVIAVSGVADRVCNSLKIFQKESRVFVARFSRPNSHFYTAPAVGKITGFSESGRCSGEQEYVLHLIILDICIAMASLEIPNYAILEIIDWIKCIYFEEHKKKIALIEGVTQSIRKIRENRSINTKANVL